MRRRSVSRCGHRGWWSAGLGLFSLLALVGCARSPSDAQPSANASLPDEEWGLHGRTEDEARYSPLSDINISNVSRLGLAWAAELGTTRGLEATPLMRDGVIYTTGNWSVVHAIDARTGSILWTYDPQVPRSAGTGCCDVVNRGVALSGNRVLSATLDGRLLSLDARTGSLQWSIDTIADRTHPYTITGAPRLAGDKVLIGNAGAEFGVRGYVSAYYIDSGQLAWRFFTVPATPDGPFEHPELERAAKTWDRTTKDWHHKGGGTVWDSMVYDSELQLVYIGTGNAPWTPAVPNPGEGDKLYAASIIALDAATGAMKWYYQQTPGDRWDFTATQHMILAELNIGGKPRKVLMQAPKNGFFYVLDRATGELLSAEKYAQVNWASGVDLTTGRPNVVPEARYWQSGRESLIYPWVAGAHNWHPMSYSARTGLVYIPVQQSWWVHSDRRVTHYEEQVPSMDQLVFGRQAGKTGGALRAWDPVEHRVAWEFEHPTLGNGGTLVTAGDVVFQGSADGYFTAFDARSGEVLKRIFTGVGIIAAPITYRLDGVQYVAVMAGFGGATFFMMDEQNPARQYVNAGRLLAFKLDGGEVPLPPRRPAAASDAKFTLQASRAEVERGIELYRNNCGRCHGMLTSTSLLPDLRQLSDDKHQIFSQIVLEGALLPLGMPSFKDQLSPADVRAIQAALVYLRDQDPKQFVPDEAVYQLRPGW
jgi:quinohemoprotein ethanol dehydrogenase